MYPSTPARRKLHAPFKINTVLHTGLKVLQSKPNVLDLYTMRIHFHWKFQGLASVLIELHPKLILEREMREAMQEGPRKMHLTKMNSAGVGMQVAIGPGFLESN